MASSPKEARLAVLIDAENLSPALVKPVLMRLQAGKILTLKRAYGDWSKSHLTGWRPTILEFGIQAIHAPTYTAGKNSADIMLVIDAVDLLHQQHIDYFCIISNDSDFTPLVHRLIQAGAKVIGFGSGKASQAFVNACHRFICLETVTLKPQEKVDRIDRSMAATAATAQPLLQVVATPAHAAQQTQQTNSPAESNSQPSQKQIHEIVRQAYQDLAANGDWISLSSFNTQVQKVCLETLKLRFSCSLFGCKNLTQLVEKFGIFEWNSQQSTPTASPHKTFRLKKAA